MQSVMGPYEALLRVKNEMNVPRERSPTEDIILIGRLTPCSSQALRMPIRELLEQSTRKQR